MKASENDIDRLTKIQEEIVDLVDEFKQICRRSMNKNEYQQFKYSTLGHLEPAIRDDSEWMSGGIESLERVAASFFLEEEEEKEEEEEDDNG